MLTIFRKEISAFFNSLIAYIVICIFLIFTGLYMWVFPGNILETRTASMEWLFSIAPYVFLFLIPAITMRAFAEERKEGTLELLLTKPLSEWQLLLGKYLASLTLVILALAPTFIFYFYISSLGNPPGNLDTPGILGSYIGLVLLAAVYAAVGIFTSALTKNQIVAFALALFACLLLYEGLSYAGQLFDSSIGFMIQQLGLAYHYEALSRGVIDSRNLVFLFSAVFLFLSTTKLVLNARKW